MLRTQVYLSGGSRRSWGCSRAHGPGSCCAQDGLAADEHVGPALVWAVETLLDAARAGRLPDLGTAQGGS